MSTKLRHERTYNRVSLFNFVLAFTWLVSFDHILLHYGKVFWNGIFLFLKTKCYKRFRVPFKTILSKCIADRLTLTWPWFPPLSVFHSTSNSLPLLIITVLSVLWSYRWVGDKDFSIIAPRPWNSLDRLLEVLTVEHIVFKEQPKSQLFVFLIVVFLFVSACFVRFT